MHIRGLELFEVQKSVSEATTLSRGFAPNAHYFVIT
jgi:hypothetical protein